MPSARKPTTAKASKAKISTKPKNRKAKAQPKPEAAVVPAVELQAAVPPAAGPDAPAGASKTLSGLDAAAIVLREASAPLNAQDLVGLMLERGLWKTEGKTPAATIYAAMIREIRSKGSTSRFLKADRGRFAAVG
ncbi:MAG: winged helix-turn-helix domain-containing protein [Planctomycetes bacterium]|nr:winged helix-turn-helix domain-containing protein [Planctomycetota bacterium]